MPKFFTAETPSTPRLYFTTETQRHRDKLFKIIVSSVVKILSLPHPLRPQKHFDFCRVLLDLLLLAILV